MIPAAGADDHRSRILIVDDERPNRQLLEVMLKPEGFHLRSAASGEEALAMVAAEPPDLILLDIIMPGMEGYEVARQIKGNPATRNIPVIMVSGLDDRNARMHGLVDGAEEFLSKPVDRAELCVRVRNLLRLKAYGDEQEQRRIDQVRFKDEFLSHVSHELRSPLTAIKQFTTILLGGLAGELNKAQHDYQQIILKNVQQLQAMIDDLLEVTRLEAGKLTIECASVSVAEAVSDCLNTLQLSAAARGLTISSDLPADLPPVSADGTRIRQILIILLDNAIKFTPDGGAIGIVARVLPRDAGFLLVEVSDTGCGIDPGAADRIFERLHQVSGCTDASRKGLGLGLYICKELVTRQGGRIWVEPRAQRGSTFSFTVPVFPGIFQVSPHSGGTLS
jgi:two-component system sensor histidine kinase/response regulator